MFKTQRLLLRAYTDADKAAFTSFFNTADVQNTFNGDYFVPKSPKYMDECIARLTENAFFAMIEPLDSPGEVAGLITVSMANPRNRNGQFAVGLMPAFWGKGFGTEATAWLLEHCFRYMGFHRVSLGVFEGNPKAYKMYKEIGFVEEGRLREARFNDGKWEDSIQMGVLASEWLSRTKTA